MLQWALSGWRRQQANQGQAPESGTSWAVKALDSPAKPGNDGDGKGAVKA